MVRKIALVSFSAQGVRNVKVRTETCREFTREEFQKILKAL